MLEPWGCAVCFIPPPFLPVYLCNNVGPQGLPATPLWGLPAAAWSIPLHNLPPHWVCQPPPYHKSSLPGCLFLPLLPVWMNVSSLSPWLSDFHTVQFSVSSGCFLILNCCCPPFGCVRRHSVSTYASILVGSLNPIFTRPCILISSRIYTATLRSCPTYRFGTIVCVMDD